MGIPINFTKIFMLVLSVLLGAYNSLKYCIFEGSTSFLSTKLIKIGKSCQVVVQGGYIKVSWKKEEMCLIRIHKIVLVLKPLFLIQPQTVLFEGCSTVHLKIPVNMKLD